MRTSSDPTVAAQRLGLGQMADHIKDLASSDSAPDVDWHATWEPLLHRATKVVALATADSFSQLAPPARFAHANVGTGSYRYVELFDHSTNVLDKLTLTEATRCKPEAMATVLGLLPVFAERGQWVYSDRPGARPIVPSKYRSVESWFGWETTGSAAAMYLPAVTQVMLRDRPHSRVADIAEVATRSPHLLLHVARRGRLGTQMMKELRVGGADATGAINSINPNFLQVKRNSTGEDTIRLSIKLSSLLEGKAASLVTKRACPGAMVESSSGPDGGREFSKSVIEELWPAFVEMACAAPELIRAAVLTGPIRSSLVDLKSSEPAFDDGWSF